jgi:dipeptidyl aminopeptidase/acylaminoacyl peptidase
MKSFLRAALLGACLCGLSGLAVADSAPDPQHPPAQAFGALPVITQPLLSPDGKHLAAIQVYHGRPVAVIYAIPSEAGKIPAIVDSADWIIEDIQWAKSDRLIVKVKNALTVGDDKLRTWQRAISVDTDGKNPVVMMENDDSINVNPVAWYIDDVDLDDPDHVYMPLFSRPESTNSVTIGGSAETYIGTLEKVDVHTGSGWAAQKGSPDTQEWVMDGHGHVVARIDHKDVSKTDRLFLYDSTGGHSEVASFDASGDKDSGLQGLSQDGKALVMERTDSSGMKVLVRHDLSSGEETPLFSAPGYDVDGTIGDEWTGRVTGVAYAADGIEYHYFDPARDSLQHRLEDAFPGAFVSIVSSNVAGNKMIIYVDGGTAPPLYYLFDSSTLATHRFVAPYPGLVGVQLGVTKPYPYKARDGLAIPAYLTLPPGKTAKDLPLVVMPHGGPDARDTLGFDWWVQFLANRGYAVLQPEYRGSSGYGEKFTDAGLQQWGLKMQDDISDGVKKAIADGIADPKRVCIVGASYGGYAALAGAAFSPDLYACAVSFAGVSDLPQMLRDERKDYGKYSQAVDFWSTRIGTTDENAERLQATSPVFHADQIRCPVLLMHGEGDTTVHIIQSEEMDDAMVKAKKPVTFIRFAGEDHYMNLSDTRVRILQETEKFLDQYIGH